MPNSNITLDQLIVLCDEIRSLTRSGLPLGSGLKSVAKEFQGKLGRTAQQIGEQLESGEPLENVISNPRFRLPRIFQAIVLAGTRCDRLPAALEGFCESVDRTSRLRRLIALALFYPIIVLTLIVGLSILILPKLVEVFRETKSLQLFTPNDANDRLIGYTESFGSWVWILPAVLVGLMLLWLLQTRLAISAEPSWFARRNIGIPWAGRILRYGRMATFCDLFSVLVEQGVPIHEAMELSAEASGDRELIRYSRKYSERLKSGDSKSIAQERNRSLTPMMQWLLAGDTSGKQLATLLKDAAKSYRERAEGLIYGLQIQLPVFLSLLFGGTFTFGYALAVLLPWCSLMFDLGASVGSVN